LAESGLEEAFVEVEDKVGVEPTGDLALKGFSGKIRAYNVLAICS